jgi:hypothetical protein
LTAPPFPLSAEFRLYKLPNMGWFKHSEGHLALINVAASTGVFNGTGAVPQGWLMARRKKLERSTLELRTAINWALREAELQALLQKEEGGTLRSPARYLAGTGFQLVLQNSKQEAGPSRLGIYIVPCAYEPLGREVWSGQVCSAAVAASWNYSIQRLTGATNEPEQVAAGPYTATPESGFGRLDFITATTPDDLLPYLVNGQLKLRATIQPVCQR